MDIESFLISMFLKKKKHHEIAEILNISEGTSKSQLSKSKKWITDFLKQKKDEKQYAK